MKKAIIIGATSGIGYEITRILISQGWKVGIAGRREERLKKIYSEFPEHIVYEQLDVNDETATNGLETLINKLNGMDLFLLSSGIGYQNMKLDTTIELNTAKTNVEGFVRMTNAAFHYFSKTNKGHMAIISSIAGTKGLGVAPAYSATKCFQNCYLDALEQLAMMKKINLHFTDIRPGFVKTDLLNDGKKYPLLMETHYAANKIVSALNKKKRIAIIDWRYKLLVMGWRLIPRFIWKRFPAKTN